MVVRHLASSKEPDQRYIAQRAAYHLHFRAGSTKVRPAPSRAADVDRPGDMAFWQCRGDLTAGGGAGGKGLQRFFGFQLFADFCANARQIGARRLHIALAKGQLCA